MKKEYLTVAEFAAVKGISKQRVYQRLNKDLKEFVKVIDGRRVLLLSALSEDERRELEQPLEQNFNKVEQPLEQDFFRSQIAEKDKQIDSLLRQIEELQAQNRALTDLLKNSQILLAAEKKLMIESPEQKEEKKKGFFGLFKRKGNTEE